MASSSLSSAPPPPLDQNARTELIGLINELFDISTKFKLDVKVPELIIIGAQSKGKSSIVEGISLQMFNFTRPDIASRFPIHFRMIYSPRHVHPTWRIVRDQEVLEEGRTTQQVAAFVERTNETLQAQRAVDSNPVLLELRWNNCPNLSFIDLPGLRSLATDENEAMLQQQIEAMARYIITTKHRSAHATFLVVEEAKDDIANFHGLSKVFEMLAHARHSPEPAASSSSATSSESNPWFGEDEDRCKFVLVLNKLDQFINNSDGSVDDKRAKIQTIVKKFEPKGIPVFFTSLPTSQMKQEFKAEPTELRAAEAFATAIRECSERDRTEMGHIVPDSLSGRVGFDELRRFAEHTMMDQYRRTLPSIRASLFNQRTALIAGDALQAPESRSFATNHLSSFCASLSKTIEQMFGGIPDGIEPGPYAKTVEQEYQVLDPDCRFSYTNSVLWKNKKYNKDLITVLNHDLPLFGGAQLRRILWEFQLCVLIVRFPAVSSAELRQRLASERYGFQAQGSQCVPWGTVLNKFITRYCSKLLDKDTRVFVTRLRELLLSWFPIALEHASKNVARPPPAIIDKLQEHFTNVVSQLSERMLDQLQHYVDTTVCDYDEFTSYRAQLNYPFTSPTPAASEIHENILRTMRPQLARTIQAPDEEELALKLTDHDSPESEETLDKVRTICAIQLGIGCRKINETFRVIFDTLFKRPICTTLATTLVDWATQFPRIVEEQLRENNQLLKTLDSQLEKLDTLVDKLDHTF